MLMYASAVPVFLDTSSKVSSDLRHQGSYSTILLHSATFTHIVLDPLLGCSALITIMLSAESTVRSGHRAFGREC